VGSAVLFLEEGVVVLRAVAGRVEIDEVHGFVGDVALEDVEVVALVEGAHAAGEVARSAESGKENHATMQAVCLTVVRGIHTNAQPPVWSDGGRETVAPSVWLFLAARI